MATEFKQELPQEYAKLKEAGKVPESDVELCDRVIALVQREETGTLPALMGGGAVMSSLSDGALTAEERDALAAFADFIEQNPDPTFVELTTFMENHPSFAQGEDFAGFSIDMDAQEEAGAEAPDPAGATE